MTKLGFGFLRPAYLDGEIDYAAMNQLVDAFMAAGGDYFDTAYTYLGGKSEEAIRKCVVERKPRSSFRLATKLPGYSVKKRSDCWAFFNEELERCGVDYFDVYMLHWLNAANYAIAEKYDEFGFLREVKAQGKARKIGFSYHDDAALLDEILRKHPEVDYVLIQLNYLDWDSPSIQSRLCYETIVRHGKKVLVMEPVKGGTLADPPEAVKAALKKADPDTSPAQQAIRFAQSLDGVEIVLSGMNSIAQVQENLAVTPDMSEAQRSALLEAAELLRSSIAVACTGCGYCASHCPKQIAIPQYFALYNDIVRTPQDDWKIQPVYQRLTQTHGKASDCIKCRACERHCPQKLPITDYLRSVAKAME